MHSFSYRTRQTLIRTLGCSWRAGAFMLARVHGSVPGWVA